MAAPFDNQSREGRLEMIAHIASQFPQHRELLSDEMIRQLLEAGDWDLQSALDQAYMLTAAQSFYIPVPTAVAAPSAAAADEEEAARSEAEQLALVGQLRSLFPNNLDLLDDQAILELLASNHWNLSEAFDQASTIVNAASVYLPSIYGALQSIPHVPVVAPVALVSPDPIPVALIGDPEVPVAVVPQETTTSTEATSTTLVNGIAQVPRSAIGVGGALGSGGNSDVFFGVYPLQSGQNVAVKVLKGIRPEDRADFEKEIEFMSRMKHERLVPLLAVCVDPPTMVLKLCHCSLEDLLLREVDTCLSWTARLLLIRDIAEGLAYLHTNNTLHRDLKSKNVLIDYDADENGEVVHRASLCDFGLSRAVDLDGHGATVKHDVGTLAYMAPELFNKRPSTFASDIYAFGLLMFEIAHRQHCWAKQKFSLFELCRNRIRPRYEDEALPELPGWFVDLMTRCWSENPLHRPRITDILQIIDAHFFDPSPFQPASDAEIQPAASLSIFKPSTSTVVAVNPASATLETPAGFSIVAQSLPPHQHRRDAPIPTFEELAELSLHNLMQPAVPPSASIVQSIRAASSRQPSSSHQPHLPLIPSPVQPISLIPSTSPRSKPAKPILISSVSSSKAASSSVVPREPAPASTLSQSPATLASVAVEQTVDVDHSKANPEASSVATLYPPLDTDPAEVLGRTPDSLIDHTPDPLVIEQTPPALTDQSAHSTEPEPLIDHTLAPVIEQQTPPPLVVDAQELAADGEAEGEAEAEAEVPTAQTSSTSSPSGAVHPVLTEHWSMGQQCHLCKAKFGILLRRHHCRNCGLSCCFRCSPTQLHLDGRSGLLKVCDACLPEIEADVIRFAVALKAPLTMTILPREEEPQAGQGRLYSYAGVQQSQQAPVVGPITFLIQTWGLVKQSTPRVVMVNPTNDRVVVPLVECSSIPVAQQFAKFCDLVVSNSSQSPAEFYASVVSSGVFFSCEYQGIAYSV